MAPTCLRDPLTDRLRPRRLRQVILAASLSAALVTTGAASATATAPVVTGQQGDDSYLVVTDPTAKSLYVYRTSDGELTGQLDDVMPTQHGGTVSLSDGRLVYVDDQAGAVVTLSLHGGVPEVLATVPIPTTQP